MRTVIKAHPSYRVRMRHARHTKGLGVVVNHEKVHRIMRLHRWTCRQRCIWHTPRAEHLKFMLTEGLAPKMAREWPAGKKEA